MNTNEVLIAGVKALIDAGESIGLHLRLLGGLAVQLTCTSSLGPCFKRTCSDADCVVVADPGAVQAFISSQGWIPDAEFNLYNGDTRLLFTSPDGDKLDVFINVFSMCHDFDYAGRIPPSGYTVHPADLVLTKLQIHEVNDKDLQDAACVFLDYNVVEDSNPPINGEAGQLEAGQLEAGINADYIARLCAADWGLHHSLISNLEKTAAWASSAGLGATEAATIKDRIASLENRIHNHGKTLAWRSRAILGSKLRWYREVEEVDR